MSTSTTTPSTIDLAPLVALQPETAAMLTRLRAGEQVPEAEFNRLYERVDATTSRVVACLRALIAPARDVPWYFDEDAERVLDWVSGQHEMSVEWDGRRS